MWGYCRQMGPPEQVQMRAAWIFLGLGRWHSRVALQYAHTDVGHLEKVHK